MINKSINSPIEEQPLGYITGRLVAIIENTCRVPRPFPSIVADDGSKLLPWLTKALRKNQDDAELVELADRFYAHEEEIWPHMQEIEIANTYWIGYYHQKQMIATQDARRAIGEKIREAREAKGLTQRQLAEITGIAFNHIGRIERGKYNVTLDTVSAIASALDMEVGLLNYE